MKTVVTHASPDLDAITSVWLIKRFLPGWENAAVAFVPAGERFKNVTFKGTDENPIENIDGDEVLHVDTGLGPLDHHQTNDENVCGASRTWDYVKKENSQWVMANSEKEESIARMVKVVVDIDHFKEVFWDNPTADYHEFSLIGVLEGLKLQKPNEDLYYVDFVSQGLDALLHSFENRIWAEKEINEKGKKFTTQWGEGIGFETINDTVLKLAQKMGYKIVVRRDPRKGYVRIKARPAGEIQDSGSKIQEKNIDLTLVYEKLRKMDPEATWFLHVSKKMLLNGTVKNPKMRPTTLSLEEIIKVLEQI